MRSRRMTRRTMLASTTALCAAPAAGSVAGATSTESCAAADRRRGREATVDRIVDGAHVVLLLEDEGRVVDQLVVAREELPSVEEGDRLALTLADGDLESACVLDEETERRDGRVRAWFRSLADSLD